MIASGWLRRQAATLASGLGRLGIQAGADLSEAWRGLGDLHEAQSRRAFLATVRSVIDPGGQTVTAWDHLPMASTVPTLLVWGARDRIIPSWHAVTARTGFPGCQVEVFERAGHFPHLAEPERFAALLAEFIAD